MQSVKFSLESCDSKRLALFRSDIMAHLLNLRTEKSQNSRKSP